jgi:hypothetical protein
MPLPSRLRIVEEYANLAWQPRLGPNPVGQAVSEAVISKRHARTVDPSLTQPCSLPLARPGPGGLRVGGVLSGLEAIHARGEQHMEQLGQDDRSTA